MSSVAFEMKATPAMETQAGAWKRNHRTLLSVANPVGSKRAGQEARFDHLDLHGAAGMFNDTEARFKAGSHSGNSPVPVSDRPVKPDTFTVLPSLAVTPVAGRRVR